MWSGKSNSFFFFKSISTVTKSFFKKKTFFYIHIYVSAELFFNMQLGTMGAANLIVFGVKKQ